MCGLSGFIYSDRTGKQQAELWAESMSDAQHQRGPDSSGVWSEEGVALSHRRLSILDLSEDGHQPMRSRSGRHVVVYNGEVYNFQELRAELGADGWRGHSDTEVILEAIERWGLEEAASRMVGMFAIAIWDREERTLSLVRDRLGIKPLYYGRSEGNLCFASQLSAIQAHPRFTGEIDRGALHAFLRYTNIPAPRTIFENVRKVMPGTILRFTSATDQGKVTPFWSAVETARRGIADPFSGSAEEAVDELERVLSDAVRMRMLADVPLGAFLSGGVDSSAVVALMQRASDTPIRTYSIGSESAEFDESTYARAVAEHIGTDHTELIVSPDQARDVVPMLGAMYDEPFADSSQIPTFLVSQLARQDVTVALSGDGGDELFAGYNRHHWAGRVWKGIDSTPAFARRAASGALSGLKPDTWDLISGKLSGVLPSAMQHRMLGHKLHKLSGVLQSDSPIDLYDRLLSCWDDPAAILRGGTEYPPPHEAASEVDGFAQQMMLADLIGYLPNDILTKVDRASMAVSLEVRVPILDHRVVELAWRLPHAYKRRDGVGKWVLREVLYRHVPRELIERPKSGFGIPVAEWLRGPLRGWAEDLLDPSRIEAEGFFDTAAVQATWQQFQAGTHSWEYRLWTILMFQSWYQAHRSGVPAGVPTLS